MVQILLSIFLKFLFEINFLTNETFTYHTNVSRMNFNSVHLPSGFMMDVEDVKFEVITVMSMKKTAIFRCRGHSPNISFI